MMDSACRYAVDSMYSPPGRLLWTLLPTMIPTRKPCSKHMETPSRLWQTPVDSRMGR